MSYHIKLLKQVKAQGLSQIVILPKGRCLEIMSEGTTTWCVEVEPGEGHIVFRRDDPRIEIATMDDMVNEPEYNDYESY